MSIGAQAGAAWVPLAGWLEANTAHLFLSTITVAEIEDGIAKARRTGATRKAAALTAWLDRLLHLYGSHVLPFDLGAARIAGPLADLARARGQAPGFADLAIAGIARANGLVLLTRNLRHFLPLGVKARDPFTDPPR